MNKSINIDPRGNERWMEWSRQVVTRIEHYMSDEHINRQTLAARLDVTPQYVSKLLSGKVNFSFKSIADIEEKLGIHILTVNYTAI